MNRIPSVLSIAPTPHYASLRYTALYRAIRATLRSSRYSALIRASLRCAALHCAPTIRCATLRSSTIHCALPRYPRFSALLCAAVRYTALLRRCVILRFHDTAPHCAPTIRCATLRSSTVLRYTHSLTIRCATPRYATLPCATPRYAALLSAILGYPALFSTLFYSINCKLTTGRMDVKTDEGCDDLATYSK